MIKRRRGGSTLKPVGGGGAQAPQIVSRAPNLAGPQIQRY